MSYKIINEDEPITIESLIVVLYGEPSMGKTSLSFTANKSMLCDFDGGVHRAVGRKKTVKFEKWEDFMDFIASDAIEENDIETIILDTGGVMLDDFASLYLVKKNAQFGAVGSGLTLKGFGALKETFKAATMPLRAKKVDLVIVCHATDQTEGDQIRKRPKMTGGSYDILRQMADLIGYMETKNNKRTLNFNPTDRHVGKNSPEFPVFELPPYTSPEWKNFLGKIISDSKEHIGRQSEEQRIALAKLHEYSEKILDCKKLEELVVILDEINEMSSIYKVQLLKLYYERYVAIWKTQMVDPAKTASEFSELVTGVQLLDKVIQIPLKVYINEKAQSLGFIYNKEKKVFETVPKETKVDKSEKPADKKAEKEDKAAEAKKETVKQEQLNLNADAKK